MPRTGLFMKPSGTDDGKPMSMPLLHSPDLSERRALSPGANRMSGSPSSTMPKESSSHDARGRCTDGRASMENDTPVMSRPDMRTEP